MTVARPKQFLLFAALLTSALLALPGRSASAQQISYFTFDTPATTPSQYSYSCAVTDTSGPASPPPLFCLNNNQPTNNSLFPPNFIEDPSISDPNYSGGQWVTQMTNATGGQAASMWFSVPQSVANGFNVWFQFKFTPSSGSGNTADGLAFVIQNSFGGGTVPTPNPNNDNPPPGPTCAETGSGWTALGSGGGCMGYGGIDNSVALEFDTYNNFWDPTDIPGSGNDNHIALQSCGLSEGYPLGNSPVHSNIAGYTSCLLTLGTTSTLISNPSTSSVAGHSKAVTLADGNLHQVVIVYNGPLDTPANYLSVYLDPAFNPGTLTPVPGSQALFEGPFDITQYISLISDSGYAPAYVGFTSGTGAAFEQHEVTGWTFTPHTQVQQTQPIGTSPTNPTTTTFNFGTHNYSVTYPPNTVPAGTSMTVIATPVPQLTFDALIATTPFAGAKCQGYDDTGTDAAGNENCIAYNVSCTDASSNPIACPAPSGTPPDCSADPTNPACLTLNTAYNNSTEPTTPGFLQGDPFYAPVSQINSSGTSGSIYCLGECAVVTGQVVNIANPDATLVGQVTVTTVDSTYQFEFTSTTPIPSDNGNVYLTSVHVQNIFTGYSSGSMDGSTTGKTTSFSDFIATSITPAFIGTQTQLAATNNPATVNQSGLLTATISVLNPLLIPATGAGSVAGGTVTFSAGLTTICSSVSLTPTNASTYTATCSYTPSTTPSVSLSATYTGDPYYQTSSNTLNLPVNPATYLLNVTAGTGGIVTANNGQQPAQSIQPITATPNTGYYFSGWTGSADIANPALASTTVTMNGAENIVANFTAKTTPTITWTPASIELGYPLTSAQLNATANVAGTSFVYSPLSGTIITSPTNQTLSVTFTPSDTTHYNSASKTVPLTVTSGPLVTISPTNISFGTNIYQGSILAKTVTISNTGNATLTFSGDPLIAILSGGNSNEFATVNLCPKTLAAGKSCTMVVGFVAGPFYTPQTAMLKITDNAYSSPQIVNLSATVIDPVASFSVNSPLNFGTVKAKSGVASKPITITSVGGTALSITKVAIAGADSGDYSETDSCTGKTLNPKATCSITVTFKPTAKGSRTATLVVTDNAQNSPQSISLSGTGN
ncbi:MAG: choice-of-anchor D domain-containing protein [Acidobacteriaceae bacterium]